MTFDDKDMACAGCVRNFTPNIYEFDDSYIGIGMTALHMSPSPQNEKFQITGWKWDLNGTIQTNPNPFFRKENVYLTGAVKLDKSTIMASVQSNCTTGASASCDPTTKIAQFSIAADGNLSYQEGGILSSSTNVINLHIYAHPQDGIMAGGVNVTGNRFAVAKVSMCKNYESTNFNSLLVQSGVATTAKTFATSGAFNNVSQSFSWQAILREGKLTGANATVAIDEVIQSGTTNTIPSMMLTADNEALVEVVYTGTQYYGSNDELNCSTVESYNMRIMPDIKEDQNICSGNTPSTLIGEAITAATYQWQQSTDGTIWTNADGVSTAQNYTPPALTVSTKYRRVVTSITEGVANSNIVSISIYQNPSIDVVAIPRSEAQSSGALAIGTSLKNIGGATFSAPFNITVYKNDLGDATKFTYAYPQAIASNETVDFSIELPNDGQWSAGTAVVVNFDDNGDGSSEQQECDQSIKRDYKIVL